ncbi:MAG: hypothetical protein ACQES2_08990 [Pseudomonadota bacterium]
MRLTLATFATGLSLVFTAPAWANTPSEYDHYHPVTITAEETPTARGLPLDELSLVTVRDGQLDPIPHQFEAYDILGLIYIDGVSEDRRIGEAGVFDGDDKLVFLYRDASSERLPIEPDLKAGEIVREFTMASPRGDNRYVYLMRNYPGSSPRQYAADYDEKAGVLRGDNYRYSVYNRDFGHAKSYQIGEGDGVTDNLLDRALLELRSSVLFRMLKVSFSNEKNITLKVKGVQGGPVRTNLLIEARSTFFAIPVFSMPFQINAYDHAMNTPGIEINKPRMARIIRSMRRAARYLVEPEATFYVQYKHFEGTRVKLERTSRAHEGEGLIDGRGNAYEKALRQTFLPGQWLWFEHPAGTIMTTSAIPEEILDIEGLHPSVLFSDEMTDDGPRARIGFKLHSDTAALDEIAYALKLAEDLFSNMKPYDLDGIFKAVIEGTEKGLYFDEILQQQNLNKAAIQELFDLFHLDVDVHRIGTLIDLATHWPRGESTTVSELLHRAGTSPERADAFLNMFQIDLDPDEVIDNPPRYASEMMRRLYRGYRTKIKNGITIWTPTENIDPHEFNFQLNHPPRVLGRNDFEY